MIGGMETTKPRGRGRPRLRRAVRKLRNVTVCLTEADAVEVQRRASEAGLSVSTWIRIAALGAPAPRTTAESTAAAQGTTP